MAAAFNLTAQLNLVGPTNVKKIASDIRREIGTVTGEVKFKIDQSTIINAGKLNNQLAKFNQTLAQTRTIAAEAGGSISQLGSALGNVQMSRVSSESSRSDKGIESVGETSKKSAKDLGVMSNELAEFGRQSGLAIRRFAAFSIVSSVIYKLNNSLSSAIGNFIDFDKELVRVAQVTGKDISQLDGLVKEITKLSTSLGVTSDDLIKVSSTLAQAGLSASDTEQALKALALSANAPSFDSLNDTVEGSIALMRQFGIRAKDLEQALGAVNAVSAQFAVEAGDIITAIQRTGGVFATASRGVSQGTDALNEFIAVFTSIRATTRESAETISTGLRTIFARIQRKDTIEALKQYGVLLTDLEDKFVGPYEAVRRLSEGLSRLDPRDLKFSQIVEELGGFRQIGKVIPLIQQFATAEDALKVAQQGAGSLAADNAKAQLALANKLTKVREEFVSLVREFGKNTVLQSFLGLTLSLTSSLLKLVRAGKGLFPILTLIGGMKAISGITQFAGGFAEGVRPKTKGGGGEGVVKSIGTNIGEILTGSRTDKESQSFDKAASNIDKSINFLSAEISTAVPAITQLASSVQQHMVEISANTAALTSNTSSIDALTQAISSLNLGGGPTLNSGGIVRGFAVGGVVPGSGNKDTVPAMLTPGEFVMRKSAVKAIGADKLHKMNRYAGGGSVRVINDRASTDDTTALDEGLTDIVNKVSRQFGKKGRPSNIDPKSFGGYGSIKGAVFEEALRLSGAGEAESSGNADWDYDPWKGNVAFTKLDSAQIVDAKATKTAANRTEMLKKVSNYSRKHPDENLSKTTFGAAIFEDQSAGGDPEDYTYSMQEVRNFQKKNLGGIIQKFAQGGKIGTKIYDLEKTSGLSKYEFDDAVQFAKINNFSEQEFKEYLAKRLQSKKAKAGLMTNPESLRRALLHGTQTPQSTPQQISLANMLKSDQPDAQYNPKYDNAVKHFAEGGNVYASKKTYGMLIPDMGDPPDHDMVRASIGGDQYVAPVRVSGFTKTNDFEKQAKKLPNAIDSIADGLTKTINRPIDNSSIETAKSLTSTAAGKLFEGYVLSAAKLSDPGTDRFDIPEANKGIQGLTTQPVTNLTDVKLSDSIANRKSIIEKAVAVDRGSFRKSNTIPFERRGRPRKEFNIGGLVQKFMDGSPGGVSVSEEPELVTRNNRQYKVSDIIQAIKEVTGNSVNSDVAKQMFMERITPSDGGFAYYKYLDRPVLQNQTGSVQLPKWFSHYTPAPTTGSWVTQERVTAEMKAKRLGLDPYQKLSQSKPRYGKKQGYNIGGLVQKFMDGSIGGVSVPEEPELVTRNNRQYKVSDIIQAIKEATGESVSVDSAKEMFMERITPSDGGFGYYKYLDRAVLESETGAVQLPKWFSRYTPPPQTGSWLTQERVTAEMKARRLGLDPYQKLSQSKSRHEKKHRYSIGGVVNRFMDGSPERVSPSEEPELITRRYRQYKLTDIQQALSEVTGKKISADDAKKMFEERITPSDGGMPFFKYENSQLLTSQIEQGAVKLPKWLSHYTPPPTTGSWSTQERVTAEMKARRLGLDPYQKLSQSKSRYGKKQRYNIGGSVSEYAVFDGLIRKFEDAGDVTATSGKPISRSDIIKTLGIDNAAKAAGIRASDVYELLGVRNPNDSQKAMREAIEKEYLKKINRQAGAAKGAATRIQNKGLEFGAAGLLGSASAPKNIQIDSDRLKRSATVRVISGVMDQNIAQRLDDLFTKEIESITSRAAQMVDPNASGQVIPNFNAEAAIQGGLLEKVVQKLGGPGAIKGQGFDFPNGLGRAASYFGLPDDIPTDLKRTLSGPSTIKDNIITYLKNVMGYADGGPVAVYHGSNTGVNNAVLESFKTQGARSDIAQGYGQGSGLYVYTEKDKAINQAKMRVKLSPNSKLAQGDKSGRPMVLTFNEEIKPDTWDLDYELQKNTVAKWLIDNYDSIKDKLVPKLTKDERLTGIKSVTKKDISAGIYGNSMKVRDTMGQETEISDSTDSDIYQGQLISEIMARLSKQDPNTVKTFEEEIFKRPLGLTLKYVGGTPLKPTNIETFANGGVVPGVGNSDTVPAVLNAGDFVIRKSSVNKMGVGNIASISQFASGGQVPALLTPGEFVIPKERAAKIGYSKLNRMNKLGKFNSGGLVGNIQRFEVGGTPDPITLAESPPPFKFNMPPPPRHIAVKQGIADIDLKFLEDAANKAGKDLVEFSKEVMLAAQSAKESALSEGKSLKEAGMAAQEAAAKLLNFELPSLEISPAQQKSINAGLTTVEQEKNVNIQARSEALTTAMGGIGAASRVVKNDRDIQNKLNTQPRPVTSVPIPPKKYGAPSSISGFEDISRLKDELAAAMEEAASKESNMKARVEKLKQQKAGATTGSEAALAQSRIDKIEGVIEKNKGIIEKFGKDIESHEQNLLDSFDDWQKTIKKIKKDEEDIQKELDKAYAEVVDSAKSRAGAEWSKMTNEQKTVAIEKEKQSMRGAGTVLEIEDKQQKLKSQREKLIQEGQGVYGGAASREDLKAKIQSGTTAGKAADEKARAEAEAQAAIQAQRQKAIDIGSKKAALATGGITTGQEYEDLRFKYTKEAATDMGLRKTVVARKGDYKTPEETEKETKTKDTKIQQGSEKLKISTEQLLIKAILDNTKTLRACACKDVRGDTGADNTDALEKLLAETESQTSELQSLVDAKNKAEETKATDSLDKAFENDSITVPFVDMLDSLAKKSEEAGNRLNAAFSDSASNATKLGTAAKGVADALSAAAKRTANGLATLNEDFVNTKVGKVFQGLTSMKGLISGTAITGGLSMAGEAAGGYETKTGTALNVGSSVAQFATSIGTVTSQMGPFGTAIGAATGALVGLAKGLFDAAKASEEQRIKMLELAKDDSAQKASSDFGVFFSSMAPDVKDFQSGLQNLSATIAAENEIIKSSGASLTTRDYFGLGPERNKTGVELNEASKQLAASRAASGGQAKEVITSTMRAGKTDLAGAQRMLGPAFGGLTQAVANADAGYIEATALAEQKRREQIKSGTPIEAANKAFIDAEQRAKDQVLKRAFSEQQVIAANEEAAKAMEARQRLESQGTNVLEKIIGNTSEQNRDYAKNIKAAEGLFGGDAGAMRAEEQKAYEEAYATASGTELDKQRAGEQAQAKKRSEITQTGNELLGFMDPKSPEYRKAKATMLETQLKSQGVDTTKGIAGKVLESLRQEDPTLEAQKKVEEALLDNTKAVINDTEALKNSKSPSDVLKEGGTGLGAAPAGFYKRAKEAVLGNADTLTAGAATAATTGVEIAGYMRGGEILKAVNKAGGAAGTVAQSAAATGTAAAGKAAQTAATAGKAAQAATTGTATAAQAASAAGKAGGFGLKAVAGVLGKIAAPLGLIAGGVVGGMEAKDAGRTTTEGVAYGALTGGAQTGSFITGKYGKEAGTVDKALGVAGAAGVGALSGAAIGSVVPVIGTAVGAVVGAIAGGAAEILKIFTEGGKSIGEGIKNIGTAIWNGVGALPGLLYKYGSVALAAIWSGTKSLASFMYEVASAQIQSLWSGLKALPKAIYDTAVAAIPVIWSGLKQLPGLIYQGGVAALSAIWSGASALSSVLFEVGSTVLSGIWSGLQALPGVIYDTAVAVIPTIWSGLNSLPGFLYESGMSAFGAIWNGITTIVPAILDGIISAFNNIGTFLGEAGYQAVTGIVAVFQGIPGFITETIPAALIAGGNAIVDSLVSFGGWVYDQFGRIFTNIGNAINDAVYGLVKRLGGENATNYFGLKLSEKPQAVATEGAMKQGSLFGKPSAALIPGKPVGAGIGGATIAMIPPETEKALQANSQAIAANSDALKGTTGGAGVSTPSATMTPEGTAVATPQNEVLTLLKKIEENTRKTSATSQESAKTNQQVASYSYQAEKEAYGAAYASTIGTKSDKEKAGEQAAAQKRKEMTQTTDELIGMMDPQSAEYRQAKATKLEKQLKSQGVDTTQGIAGKVINSLRNNSQTVTSANNVQQPSNTTAQTTEYTSQLATVPEASVSAATRAAPLVGKSKDTLPIIGSTLSLAKNTAPSLLQGVPAATGQARGALGQIGTRLEQGNIGGVLGRTQRLAQAGGQIVRNVADDAYYGFKGGRQAMTAGSQASKVTRVANFAGKLFQNKPMGLMADAVGGLGSGLGRVVSGGYNLGKGAVNLATGAAGGLARVGGGLAQYGGQAATMLAEKLPNIASGLNTVKGGLGNAAGFLTKNAGKALGPAGMALGAYSGYSADETKTGRNKYLNTALGAITGGGTTMGDLGAQSTLGSMVGAQQGGMLDRQLGNWSQLAMGTSNLAAAGVPLPIAGVVAAGGMVAQETAGLAGDRAKAYAQMKTSTRGGLLTKVNEQGEVVSRKEGEAVGMSDFKNLSGMKLQLAEMARQGQNEGLAQKLESGTLDLNSSDQMGAVQQLVDKAKMKYKTQKKANSGLFGSSDKYNEASSQLSSLEGISKELNLTGDIKRGKVSITDLEQQNQDREDKKTKARQKAVVQKEAQDTKARKGMSYEGKLAATIDDSGLNVRERLNLREAQNAQEELAQAQTGGDAEKIAKAQAKIQSIEESRKQVNLKETGKAEGSKLLEAQLAVVRGGALPQVEAATAYTAQQATQPQISSPTSTAQLGDFARSGFGGGSPAPAGMAPPTMFSANVFDQAKTEYDQIEAEKARQEAQKAQSMSFNDVSQVMNENMFKPIPNADYGAMAQQNAVTAYRAGAAGLSPQGAGGATAPGVMNTRGPQPNAVGTPSIGNLAGIDPAAISEALSGTFNNFISALQNIQLPKIPEIITMEGKHTVEVIINGGEALKAIDEGIRNMVTDKINEAMKNINNKTEGGFGP